MDKVAPGVITTKSLEFITVVDPDGWKNPATRTLVKKHAMKDVGRGRRRPRKNHTFEIILDPQSHLGHNNVDPFAQYPIEMGPLERDLVASIFQDVDGTQRAHRQSWFSLGFVDRATFYIILSNSAAHLDALKGVSTMGVVVQRYHLLALQSINERLRSPDLEASDGLIGTVAGFLTHNVRLI